MNEHAAMQHGGRDHPTGGTALSHVMPAGVLLAVFAALMAMTAITVAITWVDLGPWSLVAAMAIATVKASLVALYFMHLRYDQPFNALVFVAALVFLALFLIPTLQDTVDAEPDVQQFREASPQAASRATP
jgi:cytochrome c oxidase subunit 4